MPRFGTVDRGELARWADEVSARTELPRLIRRLILETTPGLVELGMPAGEGTSLRGWDGTVKSAEATLWVPAGLSLWEMSVRKDVGRKANQDYENHRSTPDGSPTTSATYVELLLRTWLKRDQWAKEKTADGRWQRVLAYGLDNVDLWLETAPVTQAWLAVERGFHPYGYRSAEQWWDAWTSQTDPRLPDAALLSGREEQANDLEERLRGGPRVTTIRGRSRDEVRGFIVAAVARQSAGLDGERLLARMAFVDERASWRELLGRTAPLVLIPLRQEFALDRSASSPHHVVIPLTNGPADIELPRVDAVAVTAALNEAGLGEEEAKKSGYLARRSLEALRLKLALHAALLTPDWAAKPVHRTVRSVLLAGSWGDECEGDQEVLADLAGKSYESLREDLDRLRHHANPLVDVIDNAWRLVSPEDAWVFLASSLTKDDLDRLRAVSLRVLGERDPAFDLDLGERWMANVMGKTRAYSTSLRRGLARSLVLLTVHSETVEARDRRNGASWSSGISRDLLPNTGDRGEGDMWGSLAGVLPLLAEAAPEVFIAAVREGLQGDDPPLALLFTDGDTGGPPFGNNSAHPFLLWALEGLAWHPDHFAATAEILADLDRIDPGGQTMNRPFATLVDLFYPWQPGTTVPAEGRLEVLDGLRRRHPECAWRLMVSLIPEGQRFLLPTRKPAYRDWKTDTNVALSEYTLFITLLVDRLISATAVDVLRFCDLIEKMVGLSPESRDRIIQALDDRVSEGNLSTDKTQALRSRLLELVRKYRTYPNSDWALPDNDVNRLDKITERIEASNPMDDLLWLFASDFPTVPGFEPVSKEHDQRLAVLRRDAVVTIHDRDGLDGVVDLAIRSRQSGVGSLWPVGTALADAFGEQLESDMFAWLSRNPSDERTEVAQFYFGKRLRESGWEWLNRLLDHDNLTAHQKAHLLLHTEAEPRTWEMLTYLGPDVTKNYWQGFQIVGLGPDFQYVDLVVDQLVKVGRNRSALGLLVLYGIGSEEIAHLAIEVLKESDTLELTHSNILRRHGIQKLFRELHTYRQNLDERDLALLEWSFLPFFDRNLAPTDTLHQWLQQDPEFFVEIISIVYLPRHRKDHVQETLSERELSVHKNRVMRARHLLRSWTWRRTEGSDQRTEFAGLRKWVAEAQELLHQADRLVIGEQEIGRVLGMMADGPDDGRPAVVVRKLLEEFRSENIALGVHLALVNSRGVTCRRPDEGGDQERVLAADYRRRANDAAFKWPITAEMLRGIAESYEQEGRLEDEKAEQFRSGVAQ